MLKKGLWIGIGMVIAVVALGAAGLVYAQTQTPPAPGYGMMGGGYGGMMGRGFGGMMGGYGLASDGPGSYGPMHQYMLDAFAEALGLDAETLQERLEAGETMWQIAEAQGFSQDEFATLWTEAHAAALEQAVADGVITQEQADWMAQHMAQRQAAGFGPGSGHCTGAGPGGGRGRGMGWRWQP
jgi:hypothetical protein